MGRDRLSSDQMRMLLLMTAIADNATGDARISLKTLMPWNVVHS